MVASSRLASSVSRCVRVAIIPLSMPARGPTPSRSLHQSLHRCKPKPKHHHSKKAPPPPAGRKASTPAGSVRPAPPTSSYSASPRSATEFIPSTTTEPIVLYEGSAIWHPLWPYAGWILISVWGCGMGYTLAEHMMWPPFKMDAELASQPRRIGVGVFIGGLACLVGGMFKMASSKNITRMVIRYNQVDNKPWVTIRTSTASLLPRHLGMGLQISTVFPRNIPMYPRIGKEFTVPLSAVSRHRGSAVAQGYVNARTGPDERAALMLSIGRVVYSMDVSGAGPPIKGQGGLAYMLRWLKWRFLRGGHASAPQIWSRKAFDEMIPQKKLLES